MCFNRCCHPIQITWRFIQEVTILSLYMLAYSQLRMAYYTIVTSKMNNHMIWTGWQEGWKHVNRIRLFFQVSFRTVISLAPRGLSRQNALTWSVIKVPVATWSKPRNVSHTSNSGSLSSYKSQETRQVFWIQLQFRVLKRTSECSSHTEEQCSRTKSFTKVINRTWRHCNVA